MCEGEKFANQTEGLIGEKKNIDEIEKSIRKDLNAKYDLLDSVTQKDIITGLKYVLPDARLEEVKELTVSYWDKLATFSPYDDNYKDAMQFTTSVVEKVWSPCCFLFVEKDINNLSKTELLTVWRILDILSNYCEKKESVIKRWKNHISLLLSNISDHFMCTECNRILPNKQAKWTSNIQVCCRDCFSKELRSRGLIFDEEEFNYSEATNKLKIFEAGAHIPGCLYEKIEIMRYNGKIFYVTFSMEDRWHSGGNHGVVPAECITNGSLDESKLLKHIAKKHSYMELLRKELSV